MERRGAEFFMTFTLPDGRVNPRESCERSGSRRRLNSTSRREQGQHTREPLAYDLTNRRWMSLNGSFLRHPDGKAYFHLRAPWDPTVSSATTVKASPASTRGPAVQDRSGGAGDRVRRCHGPGAVHADLAASPFTRGPLAAGSPCPAGDRDPRRLDPRRSLMVCGHCHGRTIPEPSGVFRNHDPRRSLQCGDDLSMYYRPIGHGTR